MRRLTMAAALTAALCFTGHAPAQNALAGMVDRALEQLTPAGRAEVDAILAERGITLDDVRSDPALARARMDKPKDAPAQTQSARPTARRSERHEDAQPDRPNGQDAALPAQYKVILDANLFRRLGWEESRHNPFGLAGVVHRPDGSRALVTRQGKLTPCACFG